MSDDLTTRVNAARSLEDVIAVIRASALPARFRQALLAVWAQDHGYTLTAAHYAAVLVKVA